MLYLFIYTAAVCTVFYYRKNIFHIILVSASDAVFTLLSINFFTAEVRYEKNYIY